MIARTQMYWTILKISLEERLVYRGDFALGTLMRFLPVLTQVFLWAAVFDGSGTNQIAGYTRTSIIAYYLLTTISRAFSSMPGLGSGIARDIRDGTVKKYLIQPIDMLGFLLMNRIAHKLVYYMVATAPFALIFFLCRSFLVDVRLDPVTLSAYVASLLMAFLLGFFLEATMGMIGFWLLEVNSLFFIYMLFSFFFSGHMFPIDMLPSPWVDLVRLLPLQYLAYFPSAVLLGTFDSTQLAIGLCVQAGWVVFFIVASRVVFHYGVRRYSGFGG